MSPTFTSVLVKDFLNANNCRSKLLVISFEAAPCAIMRSFHYSKKLARWRGILRNRQILILILLPAKIRRVGPKNHLAGGKASARDESSQAPLRLREDLFA